MFKFQRSCKLKVESEKRVNKRAPSIRLMLLVMKKNKVIILILP